MQLRQYYLQLEHVALRRLKYFVDGHVVVHYPLNKIEPFKHCVHFVSDAHEKQFLGQFLHIGKGVKSA